MIGAGVDNFVAHPENVLAQYDIVFAKAKAAMEAMAVGTAVVLCDFGGVGPLVTSAEFDQLRPLNFGFQALREPLEPENILRQIARYNPVDAALVRDRLRSCAGLTGAVENLVHIYQQVIAEQQQSPTHPDERRVWTDAMEWARLWLARSAFLTYYKFFDAPPSTLTGTKRLVYSGGKLGFRLLRL